MHRFMAIRHLFISYTVVYPPIPTFSKGKDEKVIINFIWLSWKSDRSNIESTRAVNYSKILLLQG